MDENRTHFKIPVESISTDEVRKTGYGETYKRESYSEHGRLVKEQTIQMLNNVSKKKDFEYTSDIIFQIETPETESVKDKKLNFASVGIDVFSFDKNEKWRGIAKIQKEELEEFQNSLDNYIETPQNRGRSYFSAIEKIAPVPGDSKIKIFEEDFDKDEPREIVINLYNVLQMRERLAINASIIDELRKFSDDVWTRTFKNGLTTISCTMSISDVQSIASDYSTIKEIKPNSTIIIETALQSDPLPNPLEIKPVQSKSKICVIDSGSRVDNQILNSIVTDREYFLPHGSVEPSYNHGTFVISRCAYGDSIDDCISTHFLEPYCNIIDVSIFGQDAQGRPILPRETLLMAALEDVVEKYQGQVNVFNLSLGIEKPIQDDQFSNLAKLVDYLSREYKVLFVLAAGNIRNLLGNYPDQHFSTNNARIGELADSLLGITVGSIAKYENPSSLARVNELSPFSRRGPGSDNGLKPEIVAHGGNLTNTYSNMPRISTYGIDVNGGNLAVDNGTSFSAPLISLYAQQLFDLYPDSDPNLVKALLFHFTEKRIIDSALSDNTLNHLGFGEPNLEAALNALEHNAAYIFEGELDDENYLYIPFHVPSSLASDNPDTKLKVKFTIVYDPKVSPDNDPEYSNARISAKLQKVRDGELVDVNIRDKYNVPWNPTLRFEKNFVYSYEPGEWRIRLRLNTRGDVDESYRQDFAIVIEVLDLKGGTDVFSDIQNEYGGTYEQIILEVAA
ncbi:MAG: S8 family peptidase [Gracilimonas sp.]|uniref:S8 family peptidase n=1 Tax=Gracilimonas sp. TaxID=1974203 RepID=UPI0037533E74|nr:S8 family peptidase [Gracilimonas sp.]